MSSSEPTYTRNDMTEVLTALWDMQQSPDCWCDAGEGAPMHSPACAYARDLSRKYKALACLERAASLAPVAGAPDLPKRDARSMSEALRIRAMCLTGEKWERNATADMMKEAADLIERLAAPSRVAPASTCDCGETLTQCSSCAVSDWQAAHPDCPQCCVAPPSGAQTAVIKSIWGQAADGSWTKPLAQFFDYDYFKQVQSALAAAPRPRATEPPHIALRDPVRRTAECSLGRASSAPPVGSPLENLVRHQAAVSLSGHSKVWKAGANWAFDVMRKSLAPASGPSVPMKDLRQGAPPKFTADLDSAPASGPSDERGNG